MKKTVVRKTLSLLLCTLLIAAIAVTTMGCNGKVLPDDIGATTNDTSSAPLKEIGKGEKSFTFTFAGLDGEETSYKVFTDKKTVGEALTELELIKGENGPYGLMVTSVGNITADTTSEYFAFYIDGEYAMTGVDSTDVQSGKTYTLKVEKFK